MGKKIMVRIGLYTFEVRFVSQEEMERTQEKSTLGVCKFKERLIQVVTDMDEASTQVTIAHEVAHAILYTQGRAYQNKFTLEELCEFVGWKLPEIEDVTHTIMDMWRHEHNG